MKKILGLGILALTGAATIALVGCGSNTRERVEKKDIYGLDDENEISKMGTCNLYFKENSEIPYVLIDDGVELMSDIRSSALSDDKAKCTLTKDGNNYVISNETGAKCTLSVENQTMTYDDYDMFSGVNPEGQKPLTIAPVKKGKKALKLVSQQYTAGNQLVLDLKNYTKLDLVEKDGKCYMPISVFNSALFNANTSLSLAYNGKEAFILNGDSLSETGFLLPIETPLGKRFRNVKDSVSQEYAEYYYQSLCFDFNYEYGLRDKFTTFEEYLKSKGYTNDLLSTDARTLDKTTAYALSFLNDGHTALTEFSNFYKYRDVEPEDSKMSPAKVQKEKDDEAFTEKVTEKGIKDGLEYKDSTVFVTFKSFNDIEEDLLYKKDQLTNDGLTGPMNNRFDSELTSLLKPTNTAELFSRLYKELNSAERKTTIKNVVIDLTTNEGGSADALIYSLSVLLGNVTVDIHNYLTGGHNHQVYKADMNLDGLINEDDKSLSELGFNIFFLDSKYSFSSANAMPYLAKLNNSNVITLGDKTAGGPCAVRNIVTPIGNVVTSSSLTTISKSVNGGYQHIDDGIPADFPLTEDQMINRDFISKNTTKWATKD